MKEKKTNKGQRGQVYLLVLGLLALGTIIVVPALQYTATAQLSRQVSGDAVTQQYAGDSAVQDALTELLDLLNTLGPGSPYTYDFSYSSSSYRVTIAVPLLPLDHDYEADAPPPKKLKHFVITAKPRSLKPTDTGLDYMVLIQTETWPLTSFEFTLPAGLTYSPNSTYRKGPDSQSGWDNDYFSNWTDRVNPTTHEVQMKTSWVAMNPGDGNNYVEVYQDPPPGGYLPNTSYLVITTTQSGKQHLKYMPYFTPSPSGNRIYVLTSHVSGNPGLGIHYLTEGAFTIGFVSNSNIKTAVVGVAIYSILITIEGVSYQVVVAYDSASGTFKIVSYQMVG